MGEVENWFVFFVNTGKEGTIKKLIDRKMQNISMSFIPKAQEIFKRGKKVIFKERELFPGYLFVESSLTDRDFYLQAKKMMYVNKNIVNILKYGNGDRFSLFNNEKELLQKLYNKEFCIEMSKGIIVGDKVYITEGPLVGKESTIRKINRHKREALIELKFLGESRLIKVCLEIVEKI